MRFWNWLSAARHVDRKLPLLKKHRTVFMAWHRLNKTQFCVSSTRKCVFGAVRRRSNTQKCAYWCAAGSTKHSSVFWPCLPAEGRPCLFTGAARPLPPPVTIGREPVTLQAQPVAAGRRAGRTGWLPSPVVGLADIRMVIHLVSQMDKRMDNLTAMHFDVFLCNFMWLNICR